MNEKIHKVWRYSLQAVLLIAGIALGGCQSGIGSHHGPNIPNFVLRCEVCGPALSGYVRIQYDGPTEPVRVNVWSLPESAGSYEFQLERKSKWEDITFYFSKSENRLGGISWNYGASSIDDVPIAIVGRAMIDFGQGEHNQTGIVFFENLATIDKLFIVDIDE